MNKEFSIIIPTLNEEKELPKVLSDLEKQTYKNFDVIVVDGESVDTTVQKAKDYAEKLNITVIVTDKKNVSHQRNLGAKEAKGHYLIFLDADMRVNMNFIAQIKKYVDKSKHLIYIPYHKPHHGEAPDQFIQSMTAVIAELSHHTNIPFTFGPGVVIQQHFFHHLGGYDEQIFAEDQEIIQRAKKQGVQAKILPKVLVKYSMRRFKREGRLNVLKKYFQASIEIMTKGKVDKEKIAYEMGGKANYLLKRKNIKKSSKYLFLNKALLNRNTFR